MRKVIIAILITGLLSLCITFTACTNNSVPTPTAGVEYTISFNGRYATVTGYTGSATNIVISNDYEGVPVTAIGDYAFSDCTSITSVTIPGTITEIGDSAFADCKKLTSVTIPETVTTIGDCAFWNCASLASITIPSSVTKIGTSAFQGCENLKNISVSNENSTYKSIDGNLYTKDGKTLVQYSIGKSDTNFTIPNTVKTIGICAFTDCHSLTSVTIGNSVTKISIGSFSSCDNLASVTISGSVSVIDGEAFAGCRSLTSIHYRDTKAKWDAIHKSYSWDLHTNNYTIIYNYNGQ